MLSHINIYNKFLKSDKDYCIIIEDDCRFTTNNFKKLIIKSLNKVPKDWDIILAGYYIDEDYFKSHKDNNSNLRYNKGFLNIKQFTGLHCYIINKNSVKILLDNLKSSESPFIDWEISSICNKNKLQIYGIYPPIACQPCCDKINVNNINYVYKCNNKHLLSTTNSTKNI